MCVAWAKVVCQPSRSASLTGPGISNPQQARHAVTTTLGSHAYRRVTGDFNFHTGQDAALRINAMVTKADDNGSGSSIDNALLWPLGLTVLGFSLLFGAIVLMRMRRIIADNRVAARLRRLADEED